MDALDFPQTNKDSNTKDIINMTSRMKSQTASLYNFVSAPVTVTWDAFAERLQNVSEISFLLYNRMVDNI